MCFSLLPTKSGRHCRIQIPDRKSDRELSSRFSLIVPKKEERQKKVYNTRKRKKKRKGLISYDLFCSF